MSNFGIQVEIVHIDSVQNKWLCGRPDSPKVLANNLISDLWLSRIYVFHPVLRKMAFNLKMLHGCPLDTFLTLHIEINVNTVVCKGKNNGLGTGSHFFSKVAPGSRDF